MADTGGFTFRSLAKVLTTNELKVGAGDTATARGSAVALG